MKKPILLQVLALIGFWVIFLSLQNPTVYKYSLGRVAKNYQNIQDERSLVAKPYDKISPQTYIRWDGYHYYQIKTGGYDIERAGSEKIFAFFPLFPFLWKALFLQPVGILLMNYLLFSLSILILLHTFSSKEKYLRNVLISLCLPSIIIFFMPYTEALFMLTASIGVYGMMKKKYWIYFLGFFLAAITRPSFTFLLLSIIGAEIFFLLQHKDFKNSSKNALLRILPLIVGTIAVSAIQFAYKSGSVFKFLEVQKYWNNQLSIPHNLRDWSQEGFGINIGVVFIIALPLIALALNLLFRQINKNSKNKIFDYNNIKDFLLITSIIYVIGNALFIFFFRGGSLNCLFRFTICNPFFYILFFTGFDYIVKLSKNLRFVLFFSFLLTAFFVLGFADYSTYWNFSDLGFFILAAVSILWVFQDYSKYKIYYVASFLLLSLNLLWTTYLFNSFLNDGWIFA